MNDAERGATRILIVDDDELDRMALGRAVKAADLDVELQEAEDVDSAWTALSEASFDLIFLDYNLGKGSALDLLRMLASRGWQVPVVALSGQKDRRAAIAVLKAGAYEYLDKADLSPRMLRAVIPAVLRAAHAEADEATTIERLRLAVATADIGTWDYYPGTGRFVLSDRARALLGVLPNVEVDYGLFLSLVHASDRNAVETVMNAEAHSARRSDFQVDFRVSHGPPVGTRWLSAKGREVSRAASGVAASPHVVGALVDVTDRKNAESEAGERAEIVESLQRFGEALTSSVAHDDIIQLATAEARRLLDADVGVYLARQEGGGPGYRAVASAGVAPEEAKSLGQEVRELPFSEDAGSVTRTRTGSYFGVPVVSAASGILGGLVFGSREGSFDGRAVRLARGVAGWAAVAIENARLFAAEKAARDRAEAAVRARDDTLAVVTHDLRNPLNTVLMTSALYLKGQIPEEELPQQMDVIKRAGHHMQRLIGDLLDTAQIDSGTFAVEVQAVDPIPLMEEVAELFANRVAEKGIALVVDRDAPGGLEVRADRARVVQALGNLVANGVKFTQPGGEVRLTLEPGEEAVKFVVEDSGSGVPDGELPHIFKRFWQGRPGDRAGAGLGLGIVKGIAEAHGGEVGVSTQVGEGSRFWFSVPRAS